MSVNVGRQVNLTDFHRSPARRFSASAIASWSAALAIWRFAKREVIAAGRSAALSAVMSISRVTDGLGSGSKASAEAIPALRRRVLFGVLVVFITRARPYKYNPYATFFRRRRFFGLWLYRTQFRVQIRCGGDRHCIAALGIGVGVTHYCQHVIER
jgi:hypothetical protein